MEGDFIRIVTFKYGEIKNPGGINKAIVKINCELSKRGHECIVITTNSLAGLTEEMYEGFKIIRIRSKWGPYFYGLSWGVYRYFIKYFNELKPDVVHIHGYHGLSSPELLFILNRFNKKKIPIIFSPHFGIFTHETLAGKHLWKPFNYLIGRNIVKYATINVTASEFETSVLNEHLKLPLNKIVILPHGVDTIDIKPNKKKSNCINLLYAGYLHEVKGVQFIIEALPELIFKNKIDIKLTIVGEGSYECKLRKLAMYLNVSEYIDWKGFIPLEELRKHFVEADIFLLMSKSENYGIVVPEALALGTPVIVTKTTSLTEFLNEPGCFGIEYPPNPKQLAELVKNISCKEITVGPFTNKIRTWEAVAKDYEILYKQYVEFNKNERNN